MPTFAYRAKANSGETVSGTILAENRRGALKRLEELQIFPLEVEVHDDEAGANQGIRSFLGRVRYAEVTDLFRQLSELLGVGVAFDRAIGILVREARRDGRRSAYTTLLSEIASDIEGGDSFSTALAAHPEVFGEPYESMAAAGEEGGFLPDCLARMAELREKRQELASKIQTAMVYPALLASFGLATVIYLMVFFIPRFSQIFADMGGVLPTPTRIVMAVSSFASRVWLFGLAGLVVGGTLLVRFLATEPGRRLRDRTLLAVPYLKDVITRSVLARFSRMLGTMLGSGVPILKALEIARGASGNVVLGGEIERAASRVREGKALAEGLSEARYFPALVREKIAIGEETGRLPEVLSRLADDCDRSLDRAVKIFVAAFEPALILVMAGGVGFILISMLLPIFTMNTMIH